MEFIVNGQHIEVDDSRLEDSLLHFLREDLDLTGTKNGCSVGVCGACVVLVDGKPQRSCRRSLKHVQNKELLTVEGLSSDNDPDKLHPLQRSFVEKGAIQCGYCIPGMLMSSHALLLANPSPSREDIRKALANNLCRCTGYMQIIDAVEDAALKMRGK